MYQRQPFVGAEGNKSTSPLLETTDIDPDSAKVSFQANFIARKNLQWLKINYKFKRDKMNL